MKKLFTILGILAVLSAIFVFAAKPNPGHNAAEVSGGTFSANDGNFIFPSSVDVGVGASPSVKLAVKSAGNDDAIQLIASDSTKKLFQVKQNGVTSGDGVLTIFDGNEAADIQLNPGGITYFNGAGNVGIGTTSPNAKLDVDGAIYLNERSINTGRLSAANTTSGVGIPLELRGEYIALRPSNFVGSSTHPEAMRIDTGGNVGIGTDTPNYGLSLKGKEVIFQSAGGESRVFFQGTHDDAADTILHLYNDAGSAAIDLNTGGDSYINTGGNLGIQVSTAQSRLDIDGGLTLRQDAAGSNPTYAMELRNRRANAGTTCDTACSAGQCLAARHQDDPTDARSCSDTSNYRSCLCLE